MHADFLSEHDNCLGNGKRAPVVLDIVYEGAVDLDLVDRQHRQIAQAGIAGAEIIERKIDADFFQASQLLRGFFHLLHHRALGEFYLQEAGINSGFKNQGRKTIEKIL